VTRLIFLGPPGSGKGTQAAQLANNEQIPHISTGELLRKAVADKTPLGLKVKSYLDEGELVPDKVVLDLVRERLSKQDARSGWILDGFPRNVAQAEFLDKLLREVGQWTDWAIAMEVPDDVIVDRLRERGRKEGRSDDSEETIRHRLEVYREKTAPLIDFYRARGQLKSVNGNQPISAVTASLKQAIAS